VADILAQAAADGAIYVEVRFGADRLMALPDFVGLFREAEERVQARHPRLRAEAIGYVEVWDDAERLRAEEEKLTPAWAPRATGSAGSISLFGPTTRRRIRNYGGPPTAGPSAPRLPDLASPSTWASSLVPVSPPRSARPVCGVLVMARTSPTTRTSWTISPAAG